MTEFPDGNMYVAFALTLASSSRQAANYASQPPGRVKDSTVPRRQSEFSGIYALRNVINKFHSLSAIYLRVTGVNNGLFPLFYMQSVYKGIF
jgi:hypothetical protein